MGKGFGALAGLTLILSTGCTTPHIKTTTSVETPEKILTNEEVALLFANEAYNSGNYVVCMAYLQQLPEVARFDQIVSQHNDLQELLSEEYGVDFKGRDMLQSEASDLLRVEDRLLFKGYFKNLRDLEEQETEKNVKGYMHVFVKYQKSKQTSQQESQSNY